MTRRTALGATFILPLALRAEPAAQRQAESDGWVALFNGTDLGGWETFLGKPHRTVDLLNARDGRGEYIAPVGVDRDPRGVFSVVHTDGAPAIRVSGEIYGALTTRKEFDAYQLRFEFKWGQRKWPPREDAPRDSGCCYHALGPHGASYGFWMQSCEFQIMEGDCGDFYSLAGVIVDAEGIPTTPGNPKTELLYRKGALKVVGHTRRIVKAPVTEKPHGEWNRLELFCLDQTSVHIVNGKTAMVLTGLRRTVSGHEQPLTRGRIQLQSEGAEVFYRNIGIRRIREIPRAILG